MIESVVQRKHKVNNQVWADSKTFNIETLMAELTLGDTISVGKGKIL